MLNERDNKYDYEESEYHFSDEEVSYEVETETPKPPVEPKANIMNRLTQSKRMVISVVVFLVLIFLVYKMLTPNTSTAPSTDITPRTNTASTRPMAATQPTQAAAMTSEQQQQSLPNVSVPATSNAMDQSANLNNTMSPVAQESASATMQQQSTPAVIPVQPATASVSQPVPDMSGMANTMPQQAMAPTTSPSALPVPQTQPTAPVMVVAGTPPVASQAQTIVSPAQTMPITSAADARIASLSAENDRLSAQLQAQYAQKINDFANQNKALQDQLQTLSTRVASMEGQMNQLMQAIVHQAQGNAPQPPADNNAPPANLAPPAPQAAQPQIPVGPEPHIAYSVQAIIPGRAWLRSENGDTVTVAEGDTIKDVGRVTKIDPYDGTVEINTGSRTVSLSYGNGA